MFRASACQSSGAYQLQQQPLVYRRKVVVAVAVGRGRAERPDHDLVCRYSMNNDVMFMDLKSQGFFKHVGSHKFIILVIQQLTVIRLFCRS
jgi:hypothetical protein